MAISVQDGNRPADVEDNWDPRYITIHEQTVEQSQVRNNRNGVSEKRATRNGASISPERENRFGRAVPVRHHATADSPGEQQAGL